MSALDSNHMYGFALLQPVGVGDLNGNSPVARGFIAGGAFFAQSPVGLKMFAYVQNRHTATVVQGALLSAVGDNDGKTQITTSGAASANTTTKATTTGLTANDHNGGGIYIQNSAAGAGAAPEGEESVIASNSTTEVLVEPGNAFSATITSGDVVNLFGTYNSQLSAVGDLAYAVQGVVVGKTGIDVANFGFVQRLGRCPNTLVKASTGLTQNQAVIADVGRVAPASASAGTLLIGTSPNVVVSDIVSDKTSIILTLGPGFSPGTAAATS